MKSLIKKLIRWYYHLKFKNLVSVSNKQTLLLDIDNTLADTWPTLVSPTENSIDRHLNLKPLSKVIDYVNLNYPANKYNWIYLTSRKYQLLGITKRWLVNNGLKVDGNIILVQHPHEKIELINKYVNSSIIYFDDLSYNQEKGELKFYQKEIDAVTNNPLITYFGYSAIQNILLKNE